jgi:hypothetical protein
VLKAIAPAVCRQGQQVTRQSSDVPHQHLMLDSAVYLYRNKPSCCLRHQRPNRHEFQA